MASPVPLQSVSRLGACGELEDLVAVVGWELSAKI
jgi:hypothetical protein